MSTSTLFGLAGAAVGSFFGPTGAQLGWSIGSTVGSLLDPQTSHVEGPRLQDRNVQLSSYGAAIPLVYGSYRVAGNVIWPANLVMDEVATTTSQGSKGGPEQSSTSYTYYATMAVLFCAGKSDGTPFDGVGRVWMNKKLVIDAGGNRDACLPVAPRFYLGSETQDPDPLMVARDGSAPAYRGYVYGVFESIECTNSGFGNRPPQIEVELLEKSSGPGSWVLGNSVPVQNWQACCFGNGLFVAVALDGAISQQVMTSPDGINWTQRSAASVQQWAGVCYGNGLFVAVCATGYLSGSQVMTSTEGVNWTMRSSPTGNQWAAVAYGGGVYVAIAYAAGIANQRIMSSPDGINWTLRSLVDRNWHGLCYGNGLFVATAMFGSATGQIATSSDGMTWTLRDSAIARDWSAVAYGNGLYVAVAPSGGGSPAAQMVQTSPDGINWTARDTPSGGAYYGVAFGAGKFLAVGNMMAAESTDGVTWTSVAIPENNNWGAAAYGNATFIATATNGTNREMYYAVNLTPGATTLGAVVADVCTRAPSGLQLADINVAALTDSLQGFLIGQQMTRRAAIEALQPGYYFDAVESDHVLKFVKRGGAAAVTIPEDDRGAFVYGGQPPAPLEITRGSELTLPWSIDVSFVDLATDYQVGAQYDRRITRNANDPIKLDLPIVFNGGEKPKQAAIVNLYMPWLQRTKFKFATDLSYAQYEPSDVVELPTASATYTARLTGRNDRGDGVVEWDGVLEDPAVYSQTGTVPGSNYVPQTVADPGLTELAMLDIPLLRDVDNDAGFYAAVGGTSSAWPGATVYKSPDGGSTYDALFTVTEGTVIGTCSTTLGDWTGPRVFDYQNSVTVNVGANLLTSATRDAILNDAGTNLMLIGSELIQYRTATQIAVDTFVLTGLLRGCRGTEWAMTGHVAGESCRKLQIVGLRRVAMQPSELGVSRYYKGVTLGGLQSSTPAQTFTNNAIGLKPFSPFDLRAARDASNNIAFTWQRRTRLDVRTIGPFGVYVPLGEDAEAYELEIYSDGTYTAVVRTVSASTAAASYSAAEQTADGLTPGNTVYAKVYQISATVGRGYPLERAA